MKPNPLLAKSYLWQRLFKALFFFWKKKNKRRKRKSSTLPVFLISGLGVSAINILFPAAAAYDEAFASQERRITCRLERVVDGDTITANCQKRRLSIRLTGIDAPEMKQGNWGERSKQALIKLMRKDFQLQPQGQDVYKRQLGIIYVHGEDINLAMLKQGQAVLYKSRNTPKHYAAAQQAAKKQKIGIWSQKGSQQNPKEWRRQHQD